MSNKTDHTLFNKTQFFIDETPSELRGNYKDGFHSFNELYDHRIQLFIALARKAALDGADVWKMKVVDGWFLAGIGRKKGEQISYHLPESAWSQTDLFTEIDTDQYIFDGHTSADVLTRLKNL
jgi:hypothetical protein